MLLIIQEAGFVFVSETFIAYNRKREQALQLAIVTRVQINNVSFMSVYHVDHFSDVQFIVCV